MTRKAHFGPLARGSRSIVLGALLLAGCTAEAEPAPGPLAPSSPATSATPGDPPPTPAEPAPEPPLVFAWGSCRIVDVAGVRHAADCSFVDVPLDHDAKEKGTTPIAVYRFPAPSGAARAQLWMLAGGPGSPGTTLAYFANEARAAMGPDADIYLVDHRGTGESTYLDCPKAIARPGSMAAFMIRCSEELRAAHGDALDGFTTTQVAHDVRRLIDSTATPDQKVFVYGGSYGSYLAHRLLQLDGVRVDGVITDGNCLSSTCGLDVPQDLMTDDVVREVMDVCKADAGCRARLGDDPWAGVVALMGRVAAGHCSAAALSSMPGADWMQPLGAAWPAGIVPALYRLSRCSPDDVKVLDRLVAAVTGAAAFDPVPISGAPRAASFDAVPAPSASRGRSRALYYHVASSEMVSDPPPSYESLKALAQDRVFQPNAQRLQLAYVESWQRYPRDRHVGGFASRDVPWLMLQGSFDFQSTEPKASEGRAKIVDPRLTYVKVRGGGHGVAFSNPCGRAMVERFVADPTKPVDTSCLASVLSKALALDPVDVQYFLGTSDPWN